MVERAQNVGGECLQTHRRTIFSNEGYAVSSTELHTRNWLVSAYDGCSIFL